MAELINKKLLLFGCPIKSKYGTIYQPKLHQFLEFDFAHFKRAFSMRKDLFLDITSEDYDKIKDFDLVIMSKECIEDLIESLKIVYKTDKVKFEIPKKNDIDSIMISIETNDGTYYINRNNYTEFSNFILVMLYEGDNTIKEKSKELSEIERKMEQRRREFERKKALKNAELNKDEEPITIFDLANYIIHADNKFDYNSILDLTVYQLFNTFNLYQQKESYNIFIKYKTSGNFKIEDEVKHWFFKK